MDDVWWLDKAVIKGEVGLDQTDVPFPARIGMECSGQTASSMVGSAVSSDVLTLLWFFGCNRCRVVALMKAVVSKKWSFLDFSDNMTPLEFAMKSSIVFQ